MTRRVLPLLLSSAAALLLLADSPSAKVGIASVVDGEPTGLPPGGTERVLRVGIDMNADEKVTTKSDDRAHLVFLDGTSLTVGPNSVLLIDKYVYDPDKKVGDMALKVERGTLRYVGGLISKKKEVMVTTPSAVMAIRGAILTVAVASNGSTSAKFLFGASFSFTSEGVTRYTTQPGTQVSVTPGSPPSQLTVIPPRGFSANVASFEQSNQPNAGSGQGGGNQGANRPGNTIGSALATAGFSKLNSGMSPGAVIAATPTLKQTTAFLTGAGSQQGSAPPGSQFAQGGTGPLQGGGPLQGAGPFLGAGSGQGGPFALVLVSLSLQQLQPPPLPADQGFLPPPNSPTPPIPPNPQQGTNLPAGAPLSVDAVIPGGLAQSSGNSNPLPSTPCLTCNTTPPPQNIQPNIPPANNVPSQGNMTPG
jgi:hypothetical protein